MIRIDSRKMCAKANAFRHVICEETRELFDKQIAKSRMLQSSASIYLFLYILYRRVASMESAKNHVYRRTVRFATRLN